MLASRSFVVLEVFPLKNVQIHYCLPSRTEARIYGPHHEVVASVTELRIWEEYGRVNDKEQEKGTSRCLYFSYQILPNFLTWHKKLFPVIYLQSPRTNHESWNDMTWALELDSV